MDIGGVYWNSYVYILDIGPTNPSIVDAGGEFVNCVDCLSVDPAARMQQQPAQLLACNNCQYSTGQQKTSLTYNYSLSVHHPDFVRSYKNYVLPELNKLFKDLPQLLTIISCILNTLRTVHMTTQCIHYY